MTEPILVVDIGTARCAAAIVAEERTALLRDPGSGKDEWSAAMLFDQAGWLVGAAADNRRRANPDRYVDSVRHHLDAGTTVRVAGRDRTSAELLAGYLAALRDTAHQVYGSPVPRLVLAVPAGYGPADPRRAALVAVGAATGFHTVDLIDDAAAIALDPRTADGLPDDTPVLVCDLGLTWTIACVHRRGPRTRVLAQHSLPTGNDLDTLLLDDLCTQGRPWLAPLLADPGDTGLRTRQDAAQFVRRLKHGLVAAEQVQDQLTSIAPPYRITRQWLETALAPGLARLIAASQAVIAAAGFTGADIGGVVLAGGTARLPVTEVGLAAGLGYPVRRSAAPEFAVVRGAAHWASGTAARRLPASSPPWRIEPIAWDVPDGQARLLRWTVDLEQEYAAGTVLAEIRTRDDTTLGLTAPRAGALPGPLPPAGALIGPVLAVPTRREASALAGDPPPLLRTAQTDGSYLLSADRHVLLECSAAGDAVTSWAASTGELLGVFHPEPGARPAAPGQSGQRAATPRGAPVVGGRLFVDPRGYPVLVTWDTDLGVSVYDVQTGKLTVRLAEPVGVRAVYVDEATWRVAVEGEGRTPVGRYRRPAVSLWDLHTGSRLDGALDSDWPRRHLAFRQRSAADSFGSTSISPDGRLQAVTRSDEVLLRDPYAGQELFRVPATARTADAAPRVAFDGDGLCLLINWERDGRSRLDVYQV